MIKVIHRIVSEKFNEKKNHFSLYWFLGKEEIFKGRILEYR